MRESISSGRSREDARLSSDSFMVLSFKFMDASHSGDSGSLTSGDLVCEIVSPRMTASTALEQSHPVPEFPAHRLRAGVQLEGGPVEGLPEDGVRVGGTQEPEFGFAQRRGGVLALK